ncbi:DUF4079 domain-containing protein [Mastigocoleus testarum]|nr:DUF4079 domain-containing protein [Mastigocoleus testarum]
MDLPSFIWLWRIAAWSMGLSVLAYLILAVTGFWIFRARTFQQQQPINPFPLSLPALHFIFGICIVSLVLLLLAIGIVGTYGHYGSLGHSPHLVAGLITVLLVISSAVSALQIRPEKPWFRRVHVTINVMLFFMLVWVSLTGWDVVQKYLP